MLTELNAVNGSALYELARAALVAGDQATARQLAHEAGEKAAQQDHGSPHLIAELAPFLVSAGDPDGARALLERGTIRAREQGDGTGLAKLAVVTASWGEAPGPRLDEAQALTEQYTSGLVEVAQAMLAAGEPARALAVLEAAYAQLRAAYDNWSWYEESSEYEVMQILEGLVAAGKLDRALQIGRETDHVFVFTDGLDAIAVALAQRDGLTAARAFAAQHAIELRSIAWARAQARAGDLAASAATLTAATAAAASISDPCYQLSELVKIAAAQVELGLPDDARRTATSPVVEAHLPAVLVDWQCEYPPRELVGLWADLAAALLAQGDRPAGEIALREAMVLAVKLGEAPVAGDVARAALVLGTHVP